MDIVLDYWEWKQVVGRMAVLKRQNKELRALAIRNTTRLAKYSKQVARTSAAEYQKATALKEPKCLKP